MSFTDMVRRIVRGLLRRIVRGLLRPAADAPPERDTRGVVNARKLGLSRHAHRADPAKKRARRLQRLARREQRSA